MQYVVLCHKEQFQCIFHDLAVILIDFCQVNLEIECIDFHAQNHKNQYLSNLRLCLVGREEPKAGGYSFVLSEYIYNIQTI